jgi:Zn-dependent peptidase ImmA (M78 family)/transcriptional regulator with XRE-family HTH domain
MLSERIRQARLLAGLTQEALAEALTNAGHPATKAVISKYEKEKSMPSAQFLILAASILAVPVSYFTHQPTVEVRWVAFRRHSTLPARDQETVKTYAADVAELQLELQSLLYPEPATGLPEAMPATSVEAAEQAAMHLREHWTLDKNPIDRLVQTAEDHHVIVVGWDKHGGAFDGLSGWCHQQSVIVINTSVDMDRRRFTLAHELGHLVMDTRATDEKTAEKLANRFAAALLAPAERVIHELGARRTRLDWEELSILKRRYGLSMAAWIYRAKDLGIITEHYATSLYRELSERGWRKREPVDYIADEKPLKLDQMAHRAVAEGLISHDQICRVYPDWAEQKTASPATGRFSIYDLLARPEDEQRRVMEAAVAEAANEPFETFEANEFLEEDEGNL